MEDSEMRMPEVQREQLREVLYETLNEVMGNDDDNKLPSDIDPNTLAHFGSYASLDSDDPSEDRPPFAMWRTGIGSYPLIFDTYQEMIDWVSDDMDGNEFLNFSQATYAAMGFPTSEIWACGLAQTPTPMPWNVQPLKTQGGYYYCVVMFSPQ